MYMDLEEEIVQGARYPGRFASSMSWKFGHPTHEPHIALLVLALVVGVVWQARRSSHGREKEKGRRGIRGLFGRAFNVSGPGLSEQYGCCWESHRIYDHGALHWYGKRILWMKYHINIRLNFLILYKRNADSNPLPPPGATRLTFAGTSGYSTAVPVPTSATTIIIGGLFGGGQILLGTGGTIIGTLPTEITEIGGI
ncbi:hypothetical protein B0H10DRAFT_1958137 [Mycena sp. CBHHK59/15]|nr:hypothetical protein B0H10DRAFT_1958137 [Mycena sp. CBHHK59/15]